MTKPRRKQMLPPGLLCFPLPETKPPLCKGRWHSVSCGGGIDRLTIHVSGLPAWWGRFPLGVSFERAKETKTRLGRSPLRTTLGVRSWNCINSMAGPGLGGVTWMLWYIYRKHSLLCKTVPLFPGPHPGVRRSRRREPGPDRWDSGSPGKGPGSRKTH